jgi:nucleotidyltransferase AbiEii toxin of type IV toxin-antitoxin system
MKTLLEASKEDRDQYFNEAALRSDKIKNPIIIEKDFWVCWTLERLFASDLALHVIFKGGTSLSKCYNMIDRFSEDINLTLSKEYIGITSENDPAMVEGRNQRDKRSKQLTQLYEDKIYNVIHPALVEEFKKHLSPYFNETDWQLESEKDDQGNLYLKFSYPNTLQKVTEGYIQSAVKLEFGARGDISPSEQRIITPYVKEIIPAISTTEMKCSIPTLIAKRTFWEKVTLLHAEHYRDISKPIKPRMFRHYYDIVMLDQNGITAKATQDIGLLADVVKNKSIYFPDKKAKYEEAQIGALRLYPNKAFIEQLKLDRENMAIMFFGDAPNFDKTIAKIKDIETALNQKQGFPFT